MALIYLLYFMLCNSRVFLYGLVINYSILAIQWVWKHPQIMFLRVEVYFPIWGTELIWYYTDVMVVLYVNEILLLNVTIATIFRLTKLGDKWRVEVERWEKNEEARSFGCVV